MPTKRMFGRGPDGARGEEAATVDRRRIPSHSSRRRGIAAPTNSVDRTSAPSATPRRTKIALNHFESCCLANTIKRSLDSDVQSPQALTSGEDPNSEECIGEIVDENHCQHAHLDRSVPILPDRSKKICARFIVASSRRELPLGSPPPDEFLKALHRVPMRAGAARVERSRNGDFRPSLRRRPARSATLAAVGSRGGGLLRASPSTEQCPEPDEAYFGFLVSTVANLRHAETGSTDAAGSNRQGTQCSHVSTKCVADRARCSPFRISGGKHTWQAHDVRAHGTVRLMFQHDWEMVCHQFLIARKP